MLKLFQGVSDLYRLHSRHGVPQGEVEFAKLDDGIRGLLDIEFEDLENFLAGSGDRGLTLLGRLLQWASRSRTLESAVEHLSKIDASGLQQIQAAVSASALSSALTRWRSMGRDGNEDYWQRELATHSFVLEHVYSWPVTVVGEEAYMGGKSLSGRGGGVLDFLVKNQLSRNAALIEIKKPGTRLTGSRYRSNIWAPSSELSGALVQVLGYKDTLMKDFFQLTRGMPDIEAFEPQCAIIAGWVGNLSAEEKRSFELFRCQNSIVKIVTFDELFVKVERTVGAIVGMDISDSDSDDFPF